MCKEIQFLDIMSSLFFENSFWLFNPRYSDIVKNIDIRIFPSWYDRNKTVKLENVFIHELNITNNSNKQQIFDCNKISEAPLEKQNNNILWNGILIICR